MGISRFILIFLLLLYVLPLYSVATPTCPLQILAPDGQPASDVSVWVVARQDIYSISPPREYLSDEHGCVAVQRSPGTMLIAYDPFRQAYAIHPVEAKAQLEGKIKLKPGARLEIKIINDERGQPVGHGWVQLTNLTLLERLYKFGFRWDMGTLTNVTTRTASVRPDGRVVVEGLIPGEHEINGIVDGFIVLPEKIYVEATKSLRLEMTAIPGGTSLRLRLVDEKDHPVQGAKVFLNRVRFPYETSETLYRLIPRSIRTDASGEAIVSGLPVGTTVNLIIDNLPESFMISKNHRLAHKQNHIEIVLRKGNTLTGRLVDESNQPVRNVPPPIVVNRDISIYMKWIRGWDPPDENGRFVLRGLPKEDLNIIFYVDGYKTLPIEISYPGWGQKKDAGTLVLEKGEVLKGRVINDLGVPLTDVDVSAVSEENARGFLNQFRSRVHTISKSDGTFELWGLDSGKTYRVSFSAKGHLSREFTGIKPGQGPLHVILKRASGLQGQVVRSEDGEPVTTFEVRILAIKQGDAFGGAFFDERRTFAHPEGRFEWKSLPAESVLLQIKAENYALYETTLNLTAGEVLDIGTVRLTKGCPIVVKTIAPDGSPLALASVKIKVPGRWFQQIESILTRSDGTAHLGDYPPGQYQLVVKHPEFVSVQTTLQFDEECPAPPLTVTLKRGGRLHVCVVGEDGSPVENVGIVVFSQDSNFSDSNMWMTGKDGCSTTGALKPGKVRVMVRTFDYASGEFRRIYKEAVVEEDTTKNMKIFLCEYRIEGTLFLGTLPLSNTSFYILPYKQSRGGIQVKYTDKDGRYSVCLPQEDKYHLAVEFNKRSRVTGVIAPPATTDETTEPSLDIHLPDTRLTVVTLDQMTEQPIENAVVYYTKPDDIEEPEPGHFEASCETDRTGKCEIIGFTPEQGILRVSHKRYISKDQPVEDPTLLPSPLTILMEKGATLAGRGTNPFGQPVHVSARAYFRDKSTYSSFSTIGTYELSGLPLNEPMTIVFTSDDYAPQYFENIVLTEEHQTMDVMFSPGISLEVQVVDESGKPVEGAKVRIKTPGGRMIMWSETKTDESGRLMLKHVPLKPIKIETSLGKKTGEILVDQTSPQDRVVIVLKASES